MENNHDLSITILVEGTGRSGITWLAEMLADYFHYRLIFEPFKPEKVKLFQHFSHKEYISPDYKNQEFFRIFKKILSGNVSNNWVNRDNRVFKADGRVVKSIRSSFFLKWLKNNFPCIPIVYI